MLIKLAGLSDKDLEFSLCQQKLQLLVSGRMIESFYLA